MLIVFLFGKIDNLFEPIMKTFEQCKIGKKQNEYDHIRKPIFSCISSNHGFKNSTIRIIAICMAAVNAIQIKVHLQHSSGDKVLRKNLGSSNAPILIIVSSPCIAIIYCIIAIKTIKTCNKLTVLALSTIQRHSGHLSW